MPKVGVHPDRAIRLVHRERLAECGFRARTGITIIAILREPEPVTGAQPDDVIADGDTLVTVGKLGQYPEFRRLLVEGP